MYTVISDIKRNYAVFSALFITLIVKVKASCSPEQLMTCAKPLSVLTDSGLTFVSSKSDLERICPDLKEAIRCIHGFTRHCMNNDQRKHFKKLFHGTASMVHELCRSSTYQEEYLKHAPCMKRVEKENQVCFRRYTKAMHEIQSQSPEIQELQTVEPEIIFKKKRREAADEGIKNVCCAFQEYVECSTHTVRRQCGEDSANFSRRFLDKMSSSMIQLHCTEYGRRECGLISAANPTSLHSSVLPFLSLTLLPLVLR